VGTALGPPVCPSSALHFPFAIIGDGLKIPAGWEWPRQPTPDEHGLPVNGQGQALTGGIDIKRSSHLPAGREVAFRLTIDLVIWAATGSENGSRFVMR